MILKRTDRSMHLAEHFYTMCIVQPLLPHISQTKITPNMITIFNIMYSFFIYYWAFSDSYILVGIGVQVYLFLDILDGNLARYAQLQSDFGAWLDNTYDRIFYTVLFICLGWGTLNIWLIVSVVFLLNFYAYLATFYIVPRLRMLTYIKRRPIKRWFMDRGFIIGMDTGSVLILTTTFLLFLNVELLYYVLIIGFILDILARLTELWSNMKREGI